MARYVTSIDSSLAQEEAFAYMADFTHAREWDPSVSEARRVDDGFHLVARFGGRDVSLHYEVVELEPPRLVVFEARRPGFTSRDTITVSEAGAGSVVHYDARLSFKGLGRLLDPVMQLVFNRVGTRAKHGMQASLNP